MSQIAKKHLQAGIIFGDHDTEEYIYMPGGEVGTDNPMCVLERNGDRQDISLEEAGHLVEHLTLKKTWHPILGDRAF
jgi:hypothetical protein